MKSKYLSLVAVCSGLLAAAAPALAHHSVSAEFIADDAKLVTVKGVMSKVDWVNPHIYFYVDSKDENGNTVTWRFENFPPSWWRARGLSKESLKIGDTVTVEAYPAKDGAKYFGYGKIIHFSDGTQIRHDERRSQGCSLGRRRDGWLQGLMKRVVRPRCRLRLNDLEMNAKGMSEDPISFVPLWRQRGSTVCWHFLYGGTSALRPGRRWRPR